LSDEEIIKKLILAKKIKDNGLIESIFEGLVSKYQDRIWRLVYRYVRDSGEAEDLAQEVFIKLFLKIETFKGSSKFYTWLYRVAINTAKDYVDKKKRKPSVLFEDFGKKNENCKIEENLIFDNRFGKGEKEPNEKIEEKENSIIVWKVLDAICEPFKTTLILREFEDLTYQEISKVMNCSIGTVESRLFRARQKFKNIFKEMNVS
jgi:RNA polymerase sigma factor (sigma-70 family)